MYLMFLYCFITSIITTMIILIPTFISLMAKKWSNKSSSFECGMNMNSMTRKPFSMQFFLLMILFVIFDIEIALILATPIFLPWSLSMMLFMVTFTMILTTGITYEWLEGSLNWKT